MRLLVEHKIGAPAYAETGESAGRFGHGAGVERAAAAVSSDDEFAFGEARGELTLGRDTSLERRQCLRYLAKLTPARFAVRLELEPLRNSVLVEEGPQGVKGPETLQPLLVEAPYLT